SRCQTATQVTAEMPTDNGGDRFVRGNPCPEVKLRLLGLPSSADWPLSAIAAAGKRAWLAAQILFAMERENEYASARVGVSGRDQAIARSNGELALHRSGDFFA